MRRLSYLLVGAAVAFGATGASANDPITQICTSTVCACVTTTGCAPSIKPGSLRCVNVDLNDDGVYEKVCV